MSHTTAITSAQITPTEADSANLGSATTGHQTKQAEAVTCSATRSGTKDAGRVHVGGGMMRF